MKDLNQITVIGLGLLGGSISRCAMRVFPQCKVVGYAHRKSTGEKANQAKIASRIANDIKESVRQADLVILASPIGTFEAIFEEIASALPKGCIVSDVGSTKTMVHKWAAKKLGKDIFYVGSHPIAGSEQSGLEFSSDDLFSGQLCVVTWQKSTNAKALRVVEDFWEKIGCHTVRMSPAEHDNIYANISHLPHVTAVSLLNASASKEMKLAGKGFVDSTRIASGPVNVWSDILFTNRVNVARGIGKLAGELMKMESALKAGDKKQIETLLIKARNKRTEMLNYKSKKKELLS